MSYCRFIEADAYIYDDIYQGIICCMCSLENKGDFVAGYDYDLMLNHIEDHRVVGNYIPKDVDERLIAERDASNG
jgi:hypothetical protein